VCDPPLLTCISFAVSWVFVESLGIKVDSFYDDIGYRPLGYTTTTESNRPPSFPDDASTTSDTSSEQDENCHNNNTATAPEAWDSSTLLFEGTIQGNSLVTVRLEGN